MVQEEQAAAALMPVIQISRYAKLLKSVDLHEVAEKWEKEWKFVRTQLSNTIVHLVELPSGVLLVCSLF